MVKMPLFPPSNAPSALRAAVACLWCSVALVALVTVAAWAGIWGLIHSASLLVNNLLTLALLVLITLKISAGRGWARWLFAVVYALGTLVTLYLALFVPQSFGSLATVLQITGLLQLALQTAAMVLIFIPSSRPWFKK
jgi:hypothetical protein